MKNNLWNLIDQKILITGATHGIGKAIADEFLRLGAEVFIVARNQDKLSSLLSTWSQEGYKAHGMICDVTDVNQRCQLAEKIKIQWGELNVLINNVGPNFKKPFMEQWHYLNPQYFLRFFCSAFSLAFLFQQTAVASM